MTVIIIVISISTFMNALCLMIDMKSIRTINERLNKLENKKENDAN